VKRDVRLHGLTSDHHHALVLARRIREAAEVTTSCREERSSRLFGVDARDARSDYLDSKVNDTFA
jgi:hypothetical protein